MVALSCLDMVFSCFVPIFGLTWSRVCWESCRVILIVSFWNFIFVVIPGN